MALAEKGLPVWGVTQEQVTAIKARGVELKAAEDKRQAEEAATLAALAIEAPAITAQDLIDKAKKDAKPAP
jgi:hypothetical protein